MITLRFRHMATETGNCDFLKFGEPFGGSFAKFRIIRNWHYASAGQPLRSVRARTLLAVLPLAGYRTMQVIHFHDAGKAKNHSGKDDLQANEDDPCKG